MYKRQVYAYDFEGKRYDVGDKFGFIKATIDFSLDREDLHDQVNEYIHTLVEKEKAKSVSYTHLDVYKRQIKVM